MIIAGPVIVGIVLILLFATGALSREPKLPDVKFIDFKVDRTIIKQGEQFKITFDIINNEPSTSASSVAVRTTYDGQYRVFAIEETLTSIAEPIGANGGKAGVQTITVTGLAVDQPSLGANFNISLYVGLEVTDTKTFRVTLEK